MSQPSNPQWHQADPRYTGQPQPSPLPPPPYPMPGKPAGRRVLGMPVWLFVAAAVFVVCCGGFGGMVAFGGLLGGIDEATTPDPQVAVTSCVIDDNEVLPSAAVEWEITNPGEREENWTVHITVHDAQGRQVGEVYDGGFGIEPGATEVSSVTVFMDAAGGETCEIAVD